MDKAVIDRRETGYAQTIHRPGTLLNSLNPVTQADALRVQAEIDHVSASGVLDFGSNFADTIAFDADLGRRQNAAGIDVKQAGRVKDDWARSLRSEKKKKACARYSAQAEGRCARHEEYASKPHLSIITAKKMRTIGAPARNRGSGGRSVPFSRCLARPRGLRLCL